MKFNNKFILISILLIALALSFSAVSAADLETVQTGEVSGGVDVVSSNPGIEYGELNYEIPENVEDLEYAGLFIDCYTAGSYNTVYGSEANVTLTSNGETEQIANERLVASVGSADGAVYEINDHTTKCFADYFMTYNLTDKLQNASGTITINVTTAPIEDYTFYNKIKLIGLVFAYNDDDGDKLDYWVNAGSAWSKTDTGETTKSTFDLGTVGDGVSSATLDNFALSSQDGIYTFNGEELDDSLIFETGVYYYIHHKFDIIEKFKNGTNTLVYTPGEGSYSFRNVLSVISLNRPLPSSAKASLSSEYDGVVFAGSDNALKLNLTNDGERNANYIVELYADGAKLDAGIFKDGVKLNGSEVYVKMGSDAVLYLLDDTIRPVTKDTVYGEKNAKVNYTVVVREKDSGDVLTESTITPALLYNGYLSKDLAYLSQNISLFDTISVSGGVIINTLDDSTYLGTKTTGRTDKWTLDIPKDGSLANGFIYLAYNWDKTGGEKPVLNASFNGVAVSPVASYRDQSNMGTYAKYGYGLLVYDVSDIIKSGENIFVLEKENDTVAVYPSTLVALYNSSSSDTLKTIYLYNGADLLSNSYNFLNRTVASDSLLDIDSFSQAISSKLYVFAASAQKGDGDLIVNNKTFNNIWNGTSDSLEQYVVDLGSSPKESNEVSFVSTGSTILALEQFIVVESKFKSSEDIQKLINAAKDGSVVNLGNEIYQDVSGIIINKNITVTGGTIAGKEGSPIFIIANKSAGGPNSVNISGINFKLNNANVVVQAVAVNDSALNSIDVAAINIKGNNFTLASDKIVPESITVLKLSSQRAILAPTNNIEISGNSLSSGINPFEFDVTGFNKKDSVIIPKGGNLPDKKASIIHYEDMTTTAVNQKIEGRAGKYFEVNLTDGNGKALKDKFVQIGFNGAIYNRTTNATGGVRLQINLGYKGTYTFAISYLGDDEYNGSFEVAKIVVNTQKTKVSTSAKTFKASAKTKTLSATLKDANGKAISGKKLSFTVNGKTYVSTTNSKGVASVNVSLSSKKTYSFTVKYGGDNMYAGSSANGKVTVK